VGDVSRARRKRSAKHYVVSVLTQVWRHPSNQGRRFRAVGRAIGWQARKRITGKPRLVTFGPYEIMCYPDTGSAANVIYFTERFDPVELAFLDLYLRPGDNVVDAGANIGLYSLWATALVGAAGRVDAFEAAPHTAERLRENLALNGLEGRVTVHQVAVSDAEGELDFYVDFDVSNQVVPQGKDASDLSRVETVRAVALGEVLPDIGYALGKLDVEGAEVAALKGWSAGLERGNPPVLLLEVLQGQLERQGTSRGELVGLLHEFGYGLFSFDPVTAALGEMSTAHLGGNVIAVKLDRVEFVTERLDQGLSARAL